MLISTKGRYALRVMIDLAEHQNAGYIPLKEVAQRQGISEKYLESIIKLLVKANLLNGVRGKGGGYRPVSYTHLLYRPGGVQIFQLAQHLSLQALGLLQVGQLQQGGLADQLVNRSIDLAHDNFLLNIRQACPPFVLMLDVI